MVACYHGYVEVVIALSVCPHLDVNWQDNEGNTALITAAQAGGFHLAYRSYTHVHVVRRIAMEIYRVRSFESFDSRMAYCQVFFFYVALHFIKSNEIIVSLNQSSLHCDDIYG